MGWRTVSLFCGCGGLDLGFRRLEFETVYACDNDPAAVECYRANLDSHVVQRDVQTPDFFLDIQRVGHADIVLGGFPCQGFSKAGPKSAKDDRNLLYRRMKDAVEILRPRLFIAENVDGISQNFGGTFVRNIVTEFNRIGYDVETRILDAAAYGLPQFRRRLFFVGTPVETASQFPWPNPTHMHTERNGEFKVEPQLNYEDCKPLHKPLRICDAIDDIVELDSTIPDHLVTNSWPKKYDSIFNADFRRP